MSRDRLRGGLIKRLHVNQFAIRRNGKTGGDEPVITVKTSGGNDYAHEAVIVDDAGTEVARVVYRPNDPLSCGAKVWIETRNEVRLVLRTDANAVPTVPSQP
jgi:predicted PP-loop superfamily ATPase